MKKDRSLVGLIASICVVLVIATLAGIFAGPGEGETKVTIQFDKSRVEKFNGKPVNDGNLEIYAHRAARGLLPEQTFPAYKGSLRLGVDYVDMDIGITKDGVIVITHDLGLNPNLTRDEKGEWITNATPIYSMTLEEVQKYNVEMLKPGTKYGSMFPYQRSIDTSIPTLKDVVEYEIGRASCRERV